MTISLPTWRITLDTPIHVHMRERYQLRSGLTISEAGELICRRYGGFTRYETNGCWINNGEYVADPSVTFEIAANTNWSDFIKLAKQLAAGQETVYVVDGDGLAHIIKV